MKQLPLPKSEIPNLTPVDQRKLRTCYQMFKRGQATAIRVPHDDLETIGWQHLVDSGLVYIVREGEDYTVFDATEVGLALGRALEYGEVMRNA